MNHLMDSWIKWGINEKELLNLEINESILGIHELVNCLWNMN